MRTAAAGSCFGVGVYWDERVVLEWVIKSVLTNELN